MILKQQDDGTETENQDDELDETLTGMDYIPYTQQNAESFFQQLEQWNDEDEYLIKNNQRQELSDGDCSGAVYMAIWDWCESELDLDVRFPAPQTEDTLDCALLEGELASQLLAALREQDLPELAAEIAPDWDLPTEAVQSGLNTLRSHLELVQGDAALLYEMT